MNMKNILLLGGAAAALLYLSKSGLVAGASSPTLAAASPAAPSEIAGAGTNNTSMQSANQNVIAVSPSNQLISTPAQVVSVVGAGSGGSGISQYSNGVVTSDGYVQYVPYGVSVV